MSKLVDDASLAMIPSAYKDGKLYSIRPTDGDGDFTFSRGSNLAATRVDVNGLIEKGRENLLLQSNQFDTTWLNQLGTGTITGGQAGYDGTNDAWLISKDTSTFRSVRQVVSWSGVATFSVYAKVGSLSDAALRLDTSGGAIQILYDLTDGSVTSTGGVYIDAGSDDIGGGWYRLYVSANVSSGTNVHIYVDRNGTTAGNIYIQDAQLEAGLVATDYIETGASTAQAGILEDMPRLDYSGGASCPALLLEPQRTNAIASSEYVVRNKLGWDINGDLAITTENNSTTSPQGLQNAVKLIYGGSGYSYARQSLAAGAGTLSVYVKKGNWRYIGLRNGENQSTHSVFDFDTESFVLEKSGHTLGYESVGNGWYRIWDYQPTAVSPANGLRGVAMCDASGTENSPNTPAGSYNYVWGFQFEASASYPTSYIPTYGASVTRTQEYGRTPHSNYEINEEQGVIFAEFEYLGGTDFQVVSMHNGGSLVDWLMVDSAGKLRGSVFYNSAYQVSMNSSPTTLSPNTYYKAAFRYESGNNALYLNGVKVGTNTQTFVNPPTLPYVQLGGFWQLSNTNVNCKIKQTALFNTALTDAELAALTA